MRQVQYSSRHKKASWWKIACALCAVALGAAITLPAQTSPSVVFTSLYSFDGSGAGPYAPLIQATDGNLYGTASADYLANNGTVFKITPDGVLTTLYSFCTNDICPNGNYPVAPLVEDSAGNFYGTTYYGGIKIFGNGPGTVFKITPGGALTTLHVFCSLIDCADGENPTSALIQGPDGSFYGTTPFGGRHGWGNIFKITPTGELVTIYSFCARQNCRDGAEPSGLILGTDGAYYGLTAVGGANSCTGYGCGTAFRFTPDGRLTTLYSFCSQNGCADGDEPVGGLLEAADGNFYSTTSLGGTNTCLIGGVNYGCGTAFRITSNGTLTILYNFCSRGGCKDGEYPRGNLIQATDGILYGTTIEGGSGDYGTVFALTTDGSTLTTLHSFCFLSCTDGAFPEAALVQDTNGTFYGTTASGGLSGLGTVFSLAVGLGPFVEPQPASGKPGTTVRILGTDLNGATDVTFNGVAAAFKVNSASLITAVAPVGVTTGRIQVTTPHGLLSSNVLFRAIP